MGGKKSNRAVVKTEAQASEICSLIEKCDQIGFDTESSGSTLVGKKFINIYKSTLAGFSLSFPTEQGDVKSYYIPCGHPATNLQYNLQTKILKAIGKTRAKVWAHNWKHDLAVIQQHLRDETWLPNIHDSAVLYWLHARSVGGKYGLKALMESELGLQPLEFEAVTGGKSFAELTPHQALAYATQDSEVTLKLSQKLSVPECMCYEMQFIPILVAMERRGIGFDVDKFTEVSKVLETQRQEIEHAWSSLFPGVSISSPRQVGEAMFETHKVWPQKLGTLNKTGWAVNKHTINTMVKALDEGKGKQAADLLRDYREIHKLLTTYGWSYVEKAMQYEDMRLHPSYIQTGTQTGRLSSSYPNAQQLPNRSDTAKLFMELFHAAPGYSLASCDFSQIEYRILAHLCGGKIAESFHQGIDVHQRTGDLIGRDRTAGKTMNFALLYGRGVSSVAVDLGVSEREAKSFVREYFNQVPEARQVRQAVWDYLEKEHYVELLSGRKVHFPELQGEPSHADKRKSFNYLFQGSAADICKFAMIEAHRRGLRVNVQIHDDIRLEHPEDEIEEASRELQEVMENCFELDVPLKVDRLVGKTWKDLK